jgi:hypothetical protein
MSDTVPRALRRLKPILMWVAWIVATMVGGTLHVVILVVAFAAASALNAQYQVGVPPQYVWLASIIYLAGLFVAPAIGALPQAVLVSRSAVLGRWGRGALGWIAASTLGGLLYVGFAMYDNTNRPNWNDVLGWYALVTTAVSLLVVGAQAAVLRQAVSPSRLRGYMLLTSAGWIVGWSIFVVNGGGAYDGGSGIWGRVGPYLWYAVPIALIGACSGFVLAPLLSTRASDGMPPVALVADR